jgi:hypothetical protein
MKKLCLILQASENFMYNYKDTNIRSESYMIKKEHPYF